MTLQISGAISLNDIRTEFWGSGNTSPVGMASFNRGGGFVASHWSNANIPTSDSNLEFLDFYGAAKNFKTVITPGSGTIVAPVGIAGGPANGYVSSAISSTSFGSISQSQIGKSRSGTASVTLLMACQQAVTPPKEGTPTYYTLIGVSGDQTSWTTWDYFQDQGSKQFPRSSVTATYNSTNNWTRFYWTDTSNMTANLAMVNT